MFQLNIRLLFTFPLLVVTDGFVSGPGLALRYRSAARHQVTPPVSSRSISQLSMSSVVSSNQDLLPGISAISESNEELLEKLESLRDQPYFRLYSVDILASCEYLPQELFECYSSSCEIYPVDEEEVSCWL